MPNVLKRRVSPRRATPSVISVPEDAPSVEHPYWPQPPPSLPSAPNVTSSPSTANAAAAAASAAAAAAALRAHPESGSHKTNNDQTYRSDRPESANRRISRKKSTPQSRLDQSHYRQNRNPAHLSSSSLDGGSAQKGKLVRSRVHPQGHMSSDQMSGQGSLDNSYTIPEIPLSLQSSRRSLSDHKQNQYSHSQHPQAFMPSSELSLSPEPSFSTHARKSSLSNSNRKAPSLKGQAQRPSVPTPVGYHTPPDGGYTRQQVADIIHGKTAPRSARQEPLPQSVPSQDLLSSNQDRGRHPLTNDVRPGGYRAEIIQGDYPSPPASAGWAAPPQKYSPSRGYYNPQDDELDDQQERSSPIQPTPRRIVHTHQSLGIPIQGVVAHSPVFVSGPPLHTNRSQSVLYYLNGEAGSTPKHSTGVDVISQTALCPTTTSPNKGFEDVSPKPQIPDRDPDRLVHRPSSNHQSNPDTDTLMQEAVNDGININQLDGSVDVPETIPMPPISDIISPDDDLNIPLGSIIPEIGVFPASPARILPDTTTVGADNLESTESGSHRVPFTDEGESRDPAAMLGSDIGASENPEAIDVAKVAAPRTRPVDKRLLLMMPGSFPISEGEESESQWDGSTVNLALPDDIAGTSDQTRISARRPISPDVRPGHRNLEYSDSDGKIVPAPLFASNHKNRAPEPETRTEQDEELDEGNDPVASIQLGSSAPPLDENKQPHEAIAVAPTVQKTARKVHVPIFHENFSSPSISPLPGFDKAEESNIPGLNYQTNSRPAAASTPTYHHKHRSRGKGTDKRASSRDTGSRDIDDSTFVDSPTLPGYGHLSKGLYGASSEQAREDGGSSSRDGGLARSDSVGSASSFQRSGDRPGSMKNGVHHFRKTMRGPTSGEEDSQAENISSQGVYTTEKPKRKPKFFVPNLNVPDPSQYPPTFTHRRATSEADRHHPSSVLKSGSLRGDQAGMSRREESGTTAAPRPSSWTFLRSRGGRSSNNAGTHGGFRDLDSSADENEGHSPAVRSRDRRFDSGLKVDLDRHVPDEYVHEDGQVSTRQSTASAISHGRGSSRQGDYPIPIAPLLPSPASSRPAKSPVHMVSFAGSRNESSAQAEMQRPPPPSTVPTSVQSTVNPASPSSNFQAGPSPIPIPMTQTPHIHPTSVLSKKEKKSKRRSLTDVIFRRTRSSSDSDRLGNVHTSMVTGPRLSDGDLSMADHADGSHHRPGTLRKRSLKKTMRDEKKSRPVLPPQPPVTAVATTAATIAALQGMPPPNQHLDQGYTAAATTTTSQPLPPPPPNESIVTIGHSGTAAQMDPIREVESPGPPFDRDAPNDHHDTVNQGPPPAPTVVGKAVTDDETHIPTSPRRLHKVPHLSNFDTVAEPTGFSPRMFDTDIADAAAAALATTTVPTDVSVGNHVASSEHTLDPIVPAAAVQPPITPVLSSGGTHNIIDIQTTQTAFISSEIQNPPKARRRSMTLGSFSHSLRSGPHESAEKKQQHHRRFSDRVKDLFGIKHDE